MAASSEACSHAAFIASGYLNDIAGNEWDGTDLDENDLHHFYIHESAPPSPPSGGGGGGDVGVIVAAVTIPVVLAAGIVFYLYRKNRSQDDWSDEPCCRCPSFGSRRSGAFYSSAGYTDAENAGYVSPDF